MRTRARSGRLDVPEPRTGSSRPSLHYTAAKAVLISLNPM